MNDFQNYDVYSSKHDGLAGSRFGWALVKDPQLAQAMMEVTATIVASLSVDIELRILTSLQAILSKNMLPHACEMGECLHATLY